ncbi:hypothetical protein PRIPAC_94334 [Pristionchus pacificus]|uniref:Uncharacterized protein n=1 Tax=Pristionchus pacificus TaxID=54126 RepID=A0A2A6CD86_PRIPA|nr:hypothetical protein PRIPAC_94334 [Pristionchus pacificus]|eukprot:PDM76003.1 hypothetical protein PRIPAC_39607 [Pristionchus pacificus]
MNPLPLNVTLSILSPTIHWNSISLYVGCGISSLLCTSLFYIVHVFTPSSMISRKYCLQNLLAGCAIHTVLYAFTQPLPILPYRVCLAKFSDMTFIMNNAYITSLSNYIDITHGLSSSSKMFGYLRDISLRKRLILFNVYHLQNTALALLTVLFIYIDYEFAPVSTKDVLQSDFAMIRFKNEAYTGLFIMIAFGGFVVFYIASIFYLNFYIFRRLRDLKPTISEKTYEILEKMSHLFAFVVISPVFFFHVPHLLFVVCNYYIPSIVSTSGSLEAITIITTVLYALFPFSFYVFLLIGFKQYRHAFFHLITCRRFAIKSSPANSRHS